MQTLYSDLAKYFDLIAAASAVDTQKEVEFLQTVFSKHTVHSVLDIACGTGRHSIALAERGYDVTGVDYSEELLKVARGKAPYVRPTGRCKHKARQAI
jgi:ubiquinone/menaquinone biosynthesis C-methylase UbiE